MGALELGFEEVVVQKHSTKTQPHKAGKVRLTGFVGSATLRYTDSAVTVTKALGQLGKLAFFSGVGAKTPYGMGQIRVAASTRSAAK